MLIRNSAPAWTAGWPPVPYVHDLETTIRDAKEVAGEKNVLVHGAEVAQRALTARTFSTNSKYNRFQSCSATEGQRLFENLGVKQRQLERIIVLGGDQAIAHPRALPRSQITPEERRSLGRERSKAIPVEQI
jgi:hypothetical protein